MEWVTGPVGRARIRVSVKGPDSVVHTWLMTRGPHREVPYDKVKETLY
jgi:hypothetical protein